MKNVYYKILGIFIIFTVTYIYAAPPAGYGLVWSDEFNSGTKPDPNIWGTKQGVRAMEMPNGNIIQKQMLLLKMVHVLLRQKEKPQVGHGRIVRIPIIHQPECILKVKNFLNMVI